jgi:D-3-phosphoglycerate dehydrogenase
MCHNIRTLNKLSEDGLRQFGAGYHVSADIANPEAILLRSATLHTDDYPNLLAVARAGAGVNNISVGSATEKGICVFNTPGANANAVAELVFIVLGMHARKVDKALEFVRPLVTKDNPRITALVEEHKATFRGFELAGKTLGIIGLGKIGVLVANAGVERGMKVIGFDAFPTLANMHQLDRRVVVARKMDEVLCQADIVSIHVPLLKETTHLIGERQIALMKDGVVLINYSRERICNDDAVMEALHIDKLSAYLTDFPTRELLENDKVICTPHLGASTNESEENCTQMAARQLKNYLEYGIVANSVNFPTLEVFPHQNTRTRLVIVNRDVPGMIATMTGIIGKAGINISAFTNAGNGTVGYNLVDIDTELAGNVEETLWGCSGILRVRTIRFPR